MLCYVCPIITAIIVIAKASVAAPHFGGFSDARFASHRQAAGGSKGGWALGGNHRNHVAATTHGFLRALHICV